jgi:hypothetical protein
MRYNNIVKLFFVLAPIAPIVPAHAATCQAGSTAVGVQRACWHMDESPGANTMQDAVDGNNGSLINVITGHFNPPPCFLNLCYEFKGTPSVAVVPNSATLNPGAADFSMSEHVNTGVIPPPSVGDYDVVRKGLSSSAGGDYKMEVLPKSQGTVAKASCHFKGSSAGSTLTKGPNLADNKWHTIVCTKTSTAIKLQVDGQVFSKTVTIGSISNSDDVNVGAKSSLGADQYTGLMDEVSISIK